MKTIFAMSLLLLLGACTTTSGLATDTMRVANDLGNAAVDVVHGAADVVVNTAADVDGAIRQVIPPPPAVY
jgi:hypothetical protein